MRTQIHQFPWPLGFGLVGFFVAFFIQFRLKYHIDREKVLELDDMSELYPSGIPPKRILTQRGQQLHLWLKVGVGIFVASVILCMILYAR